MKVTISFLVYKSLKTIISYFSLKNTRIPSLELVLEYFARTNLCYLSDSQTIQVNQNFLLSLI